MNGELLPQKEFANWTFLEKKMPSMFGEGVIIYKTEWLFGSCLDNRPYSSLVSTIVLVHFSTLENIFYFSLNFGGTISL